MTISIIDYGAGNVQSVKYALDRLGVSADITDDPEKIKSADKVIFPGVGAAASAMKALHEKNLATLIPELTQPVLGICLGMQLMCNWTEEGDTDCLGIFPADIISFSTEVKVPHMGWNQLTHLKGELFRGLKNPYVYFVHGFHLQHSPDAIAMCDYGNIFTAAIQKNNFYACQFHPEKSGTVGATIIKNFLAL